MPFSFSRWYSIWPSGPDTSDPAITLLYEFICFRAGRTSKWELPDSAFSILRSSVDRFFFSSHGNHLLMCSLIWVCRPIGLLCLSSGLKFLSPLIFESIPFLLLFHRTELVLVSSGLPYLFIWSLLFLSAAYSISSFSLKYSSSVFALVWTSFK